MNFTQKWIRAFVSLALLVLLASCAGSSKTSNNSPAQGIAVLGVVTAPGVEAGRSRSAMALDFEQILRSGRGYQTLSTEALSQAVESATPGSFQHMISNYGANGWLKGDDMRALFAANLPVNNVLIARLEKNELRPGAPESAQVRSASGGVVDDRERVVLSTIREMRLQTSLINLVSGRVTWTKTYRATPAEKSSYVRYKGETFSGSLAASVANTLTNGLGAPSAPKGPDNDKTLQALMQEVVKNLP